MRASIVGRVAIVAAGCAVLGAAGPASAAYVDFRSPTGKIGCAAHDDPYNLRCDVQSPSFTRPPRPSWCDSEIGDSFNMSARGRPQWTCHGDTTLGARKVLGYGRSWSWGPFRCTMRTSGVTCYNAAGHGFSLSTQRARRW